MKVEKYQLKMFLGFPTFDYESNQWFSKIESFEVLYQMLEQVSKYYDTPLKSSFNRVDENGRDDFLSYGMYSEYSGTKSLFEYLKENGIILKNYK